MHVNRSSWAARNLRYNNRIPDSDRDAEFGRRLSRSRGIRTWRCACLDAQGRYACACVIVFVRVRVYASACVRACMYVFLFMCMPTHA